MVPSPLVLILFGSLNPITVMHLRMFELAKHHFLTNTQNIFTHIKGVISPTNDAYALLKPSLSPAFHRLEMIKLALKDVESNWITYNSWETDQKDWIRTLPALRHYSNVYGPNLKLICGADLFESFLTPDLWSDEHIEEILRVYGLVVVPRKGAESPLTLSLNSSKSHIFKKYINQIEVLGDFTIVEVSSTMVREAVKKGQPIDHLVTKSVARYIKDKGLYCY